MSFARTAAEKATIPDRTKRLETEFGLLSEETCRTLMLIRRLQSSDLFGPTFTVERLLYKNRAAGATLTSQ